MRVMRTYPHSGRLAQVRLEQAAKVDHRDDPFVPTMKPLPNGIRELGWDDKFCATQHRDRKADRLAKRRISRKYKHVVRQFTLAEGE
jgi:hypothetical protein